MRGASALDRALQADADVSVRAWVEWLPVLVGDRVPWRPTSQPMADPRVEQAWDPGRTVSTHLREQAKAHPDWLTDDERAVLADPDAIVWDVVLVWPPGASWDDPPAFHAAPVVSAEDTLADEIRKAATP